MKILLASNNAHKRMEIEGVIRQCNASATIVQPRDAGFSFDVVEDGTTFAENAFLKAHSLAMLLRGKKLPGVTLDCSLEELARRIDALFPDRLPPVLADDSGICVHALENRPGVYSARYGNVPGSPPLDDEGRNALLLRELAEKPDAVRTAHYVCHAVLYHDPDRFIQVQETWHGEIAREPAYGETGFGYDPLFTIPGYGRTVAQISQDEKDRISHRAKAVTALLRAADRLQETGLTGA